MRARTVLLSAALPTGDPAIALAFVPAFLGAGAPDERYPLTSTVAATVAILSLFRGRVLNKKTELYANPGKGAPELSSRRSRAFPRGSHSIWK
jgi:hypothetical protein